MCITWTVKEQFINLARVLQTAGPFLDTADVFTGGSVDGVTPDFEKKPPLASLHCEFVLATVSVTLFVFYLS